jgi:hypothetical protein
VDSLVQSLVLVISMNSETTIFISAVFELLGLNKGGNSTGLPMISMGLLWLSWQLVRLGQVLRYPLSSHRFRKLFVAIARALNFTNRRDECGR